MEDRPLTGCKVNPTVGLKVDAFGDHGKLVPWHAKIADEFITKLCRRGDHVVAPLGAEPPNDPPHRSKSPTAKLEIVDNLDDCAAEREGHCLAVDHKVRPKAIDSPLRAKPRRGGGKPRQRRATQGKDRQIETRS
jgi:hypothetical protein